MFSEEKIIAILKRAIPGAQVEVSDMTGTRDHFQVQVTASAFKEKSLVEQHQMVMAPLKGQIADDSIHALSIKTKVL
jgi:acid stress-induced BolA-like protein IbaG/YrbA